VAHRQLHHGEIKKLTPPPQAASKTWSASYLRIPRWQQILKLLQRQRLDLGGGFTESFNLLALDAGNKQYLGTTIQ